MEYRYTAPLLRIISLENITKENDMNYLHRTHTKTQQNTLNRTCMTYTNRQRCF